MLLINPAERKLGMLPFFKISKAQLQNITEAIKTIAL